MADDRVTKRLFDLLLAGLGLLLLSPLFIAIAAWIRLDTPGPAFFRQERVGRYGKIFRIHKFRTMAHDPGGSGPQITMPADSRVTRVGACLRRSKLDELPQLIDVLRGDMSLVGPRPEVPRYVALYSDELKDRVLSVRPGITDPVSLEFSNESEQLARAADPEREYREVLLPTKLRAAAAYVERATFWTDLRVLGRTLCLLVRR